MRLPRLALLTLIASALVLAGCPWDDDDSCSQDAGVPGTDGTQPPPVCVDPCEGPLVFGPETFDRTTCAPVTEVRSFELDVATDVCLKVSNNGVAAAWIKINGIKYVKPSDFNPNVTDIIKTLALGAGVHELKVRVASSPGSSITVEVRACDQGPPPPRLCSEVARELCESKGWTVVSEPDPPIGNIVCTVDGRDSVNNCGTCAEYNIVVWQDASPEQHCPGSYSTLAGSVYGGHIPCTCADNLYWCQTWDMQGCIPD